MFTSVNEHTSRWVCPGPAMPSPWRWCLVTYSGRGKETDKEKVIWMASHVKTAGEKSRNAGKLRHRFLSKMLNLQDFWRGKSEEPFSFLGISVLTRSTFRPFLPKKMALKPGIKNCIFCTTVYACKPRVDKDCSTLAECDNVVERQNSIFMSVASSLFHETTLFWGNSFQRCKVFPSDWSSFEMRFFATEANENEGHLSCRFQVCIFSGFL